MLDVQWHNISICLDAINGTIDCIIDCISMIYVRIFEMHLDAEFSLFAEINMCKPEPCRNGAKCTNRRTDFYCDCLPGFSGKTCETSR